MIRRPPRSTLSSSSAASDVYKRQEGWKSKPDVLSTDQFRIHRTEKPAERYHIQIFLCGWALQMHRHCGSLHQNNWRPFLLLSQSVSRDHMKPAIQLLEGIEEPDTLPSLCRKESQF